MPNTQNRISLAGAPSAVLRSPSSWSAVQAVILPLRQMVITGIMRDWWVKSRSCCRQTLLCRQMVAVKGAPVLGQITTSVSSYSLAFCWWAPLRSQKSTRSAQLSLASRKWFLLAKTGSPMKERFMRPLKDWQKLALGGYSSEEASMWSEMVQRQTSKPYRCRVRLQLSSPTRQRESKYAYCLSAGVLIGLNCAASPPPSGTGSLQGLINSVCTSQPSKQVWLQVTMSFPLQARQTRVKAGSEQPVQKDCGVRQASSKVAFSSLSATLVSMEGSPPCIGSMSLSACRKGSTQPKSSSLTVRCWVNPPKPTSMVTKRMQSMRRVLLVKWKRRVKKAGSWMRVRFWTIGPLNSLSKESRSVSCESLRAVLSSQGSPQATSRKWRYSHSCSCGFQAWAVQDSGCCLTALLSGFLVMLLSMNCLSPSQCPVHLAGFLQWWCAAMSAWAARSSCRMEGLPRLHSSPISQASKSFSSLNCHAKYSLSHGCTSRRYDLQSSAPTPAHSLPALSAESSTACSRNRGQSGSSSAILMARSSSRIQSANWEKDWQRAWEKTPPSPAIFLVPLSLDCRMNSKAKYFAYSQITTACSSLSPCVSPLSRAMFYFVFAASQALPASKSRVRLPTLRRVPLRGEYSWRTVSVEKVRLWKREELSMRGKWYLWKEQSSGQPWHDRFWVSHPWALRQTESVASPLGGFLVSPEEESCRMARSQFSQCPPQYQLSTMRSTVRHQRSKTRSKACSCARLRLKYLQSRNQEWLLLQQEKSTHTSQLLPSPSPYCRSPQSQSHSAPSICSCEQSAAKAVALGRNCACTPCPIACIFMVALMARKSPPKPWMASWGRAMLSSCDQKPMGARLSTWTLSLKSREWGSTVKNFHSLKSTQERSGEQVALVKLLRSCMRQPLNSRKTGFWPRQRNSRGLLRLKKVKLRSSVVFVFPGFCPQSSMFSGASTTPSRITESITPSRPTTANSRSPVNKLRQTALQIRRFLQAIFVDYQQGHNLCTSTLAHQTYTTPLPSIPLKCKQRQQNHLQQPKLERSLLEKSARQSSLSYDDFYERFPSRLSCPCSISLICEMIAGSISDTFLFIAIGLSLAGRADFSVPLLSFWEADCLRLLQSGTQLLSRLQRSSISCMSCLRTPSNLCFSQASQTLASFSCSFSFSIPASTSCLFSSYCSVKCTRASSSLL